MSLKILFGNHQGNIELKLTLSNFDGKHKTLNVARKAASDQACEKTVRHFIYPDAAIGAIRAAVGNGGLLPKSGSGQLRGCLRRCGLLRHSSFARFKIRARGSGAIQPAK
jgi:hypothetical protein